MKTVVGIMSTTTVVESAMQHHRGKQASNCIPQYTDVPALGELLGPGMGNETYINKQLKAVVEAACSKY